MNKARYTLWLRPDQIAKVRKKTEEHKKDKKQLNGSEWVGRLIDRAK